MPYHDVELELQFAQRDAANWKQAYGDAREDLDAAKSKIAWLEAENYDLRHKVRDLERELGR